MTRQFAWTLVALVFWIEGASAQMVRVPTPTYVPPVVVVPPPPITTPNLNVPTIVVPPPPPAIHSYPEEVHVPHCDDEKRRQGSC